MKSYKFLNKLMQYQESYVIIAIFCFFFILRLYRLGYHDFWYDEIGTVHYAQRPWNNWNAPLYWILLHFWAKIFKISEFSLRFPSLIFSFFTVILVFFLGKSLFNKKVGVIASFLTGFSPFHLWYAQEARDYSMVLFLGTLSSYYFSRAIKEEKNKLWLFFIITSLFGFYTNYFYFFLFFSQCIYAVFFKKFKFNFNDIVPFLIIIIGFIPRLFSFFSKFYFVWQGFWLPKPTLQSLVITLENFILGYYGFFSLYLSANILAGLFLISAVWTVCKGDSRQPFMFCMFLFFIPIISIFFFSKIFFSIYLDRGLLLFSPYYFLILSLGFVSLNRFRRLWGVLFAILIFIMSMGGYIFFNDLKLKIPVHHQTVVIKKPVKAVVKFLEDNVVSGKDIISFTNRSTMPAIDFYCQKKLSHFHFLFNPEFTDETGRPVHESKRRVSLHRISLLEFTRLWVISSDWPRSGKLDENSQSVKDWLDKNYKLEFTWEFDGLFVFRYVKKF